MATGHFQSLALVDDDEELEEIEEDLDFEDYDGSDGDDADVSFVDVGEGQSAEDNKFDAIVGALEDLMMRRRPRALGADGKTAAAEGSDDFEKLQREFGVANCQHFEEEAGENKLVYMEIFEKYSDLLEAAITDHLSAAIDGFDLMELVGMLKARKHELDGEVFDMMLTLTDFEAFKELMLAYKAETVQDFKGLDLALSTSGVQVHQDEQEDGDERPDLDFACHTVSSMKSPSKSAGPSGSGDGDQSATAMSP